MNRLLFVIINISEMILRLNYSKFMNFLNLDFAYIHKKINGKSVLARPKLKSSRNIKLELRLD